MMKDKKRLHTATITVDGKEVSGHKPITGDHLLVMSITNPNSKESAVEAGMAGSVDMSSELLDMYGRAFFSMITEVTGEPSLAFAVGLSSMINGISNGSANLSEEQQRLAAGLLEALADNMTPVMADLHSDLESRAGDKK